MFYNVHRKVQSTKVNFLFHYKKIIKDNFIRYVFDRFFIGFSQFAEKLKKNNTFMKSKLH